MGGKFCYKVHKTGLDVTLAVCDSDVSGKVLKLGEIDFDVSTDFYGEETTDEEHIKQLFERAKVINAVGKNAMKLLVNEGLAKEGSALIIEGVPHVQVISF